MKKEANENATLRHAEMIYLEPAQEVIGIPKDRFESSWTTRVSPISLKSLPKKISQSFHRKKSSAL